MTLDEKRDEVARRMARARVYDGENSTGLHEEFYGLLLYGFRGSTEWSEPELDEYLDAHDEDGQSVE